MVAPWVFEQFVALHGPVLGAEDVVDAEPAAQGLVAAGPLAGGLAVGILHALFEPAVGVRARGIVEVATHDGGELASGYIQLQGVGLGVATLGILDEVGGEVPGGLEVGVPQAEGLGGVHLYRKGLVIGVGVESFPSLVERVLAEDGEVEHFVLPLFVADGIGILGESGPDGVPADEVLVRTFLQADDIGVEVTDVGCSLVQGVGADVEVGDVPRQQADGGLRVAGGIGAGGHVVPKDTQATQGEDGKNPSPVTQEPRGEQDYAGSGQHQYEGYGKQTEEDVVAGPARGEVGQGDESESQPGQNGQQEVLQDLEVEESSHTRCFRCWQ